MSRAHSTHCTKLLLQPTHCSSVVVEYWLEVAMSQDGLLEDLGSEALFRSAAISLWALFERLHRSLAF